MEKKTVLVLPGSNWQIPIIKKIKEMNYRVLVVNPYKNSPAFQYADGFLQCDIFLHDMVIEYCKSEKVEAIISDECDIAMPIIASYGEELNFTVLSNSAARLFTDKYAMRIFGEEKGVANPEFSLCCSIEDAIGFWGIHNRKMIMKPLDSNSSRGVFVIQDISDIHKYFEETKRYSKIDDGVIMEEYIEGVEFTVDGIKTPDKHFSLAVSKKKHFDYNPNIASELYFTHSDSTFDYKKLKEVNDTFVEASGLQFGLTHAEYKYEKGNFYLIEIAARGGGNLISSDIVPYMSGVDNYEYLINCSLGDVRNADFTILEEYKSRAAVLKFFEPPADGKIVERIDGLEFMENCPEIRTYQFNFNIGEEIEKATNDATRAGYYIACCENEDKLIDIMNKIEHTVKIVCK